MMTRRVMRIAALVVFALGFLAGTALAVAGVWPDLEASMFDDEMLADAPLDTLRCPLLITKGETGKVTASFTNSRPRTSHFPVRVHIAYRFVIWQREIQEQLALAPGETRQLEWTVTADDAVYRSVILLRVHDLRTAPDVYRNGSCGILVLDVAGLSGGTVVALALAFSLAAMAGGMVLWVAGRRPPAGREREAVFVMGVLAALALGGVAAGYWGWWELGVVLLALIVLLLATALARWARVL